MLDYNGIDYTTLEEQAELLLTYLELRRQCADSETLGEYTHVVKAIKATTNRIARAMQYDKPFDDSRRPGGKQYRPMFNEYMTDEEFELRFDAAEEAHEDFVGRVHDRVLCKGVQLA